jgi:hypothetical protein
MRLKGPLQKRVTPPRPATTLDNVLRALAESRDPLVAGWAARLLAGGERAAGSTPGRPREGGGA